jgi:CTP:molybdopterin cytidylyltransferase MocA
MVIQKALLRWGAKTLLEYQLIQLGAVQRVDEIVVVTGYRADRLAPIIERSKKARAVHNAGWEQGKAGSVRTGVAAVDAAADCIMLIAVDQPRPAMHLRELCAAHERSRAQITLPVHEGRRGHPLLLRRSLLPELMAIDDATMGVRAVVERHSGEINEVPFDDPIVTFDLNTPDDFADAGQ